MQIKQRQFCFGQFIFDAEHGLLLRDGEPQPLGQRGLKVLQTLLEARGRVVDKATIFELAWPGLVVEESNFSVQITALRKLLGQAPDGTDWSVTAPRLGYRLVGSVALGEVAANASRDAELADEPVSEQRPSIAVMPFSNLSADPAQEYFADGITDDVIAALTRFRWFFVTGRSTSYAFKGQRGDARLVGRELGVRYAHYSLAIMGVMSDSFDLAIRGAEKAVEVSPSFALGHLVLGMARLYSGNAEAAILPLEQGLELNRHDPHNFVWYNVLALSQLFRGEAEAGLRRAEMSLKIRPQWRSAMETMAACCAELGQVDSAREWRERLAELAPAPGDALQPMWRRNPVWAARMQAWLAG